MGDPFAACTLVGIAKNGGAAQRHGGAERVSGSLCIRVEIHRFAGSMAVHPHPAMRADGDGALADET
jgi:hypothetical protein